MLKRSYCTYSLKELALKSPYYAFLSSDVKQYNTIRNAFPPFNGKYHPSNRLCFTSRPNVFYKMLDFKQIAYVNIPSDAKIRVALDKYWTDNAEIVKFIDIADMDEWKDPIFCLEAVTHNAHLLKYVRKKTFKMCALAFTRHQKWCNINLKNQILMRFCGYGLFR